MRHVAIALLLLPLSASASGRQAAQDTPGLVFEVAAITRNVSTEANGTLALQPGGYFRAINFPVSSLIAFAYRTGSRNLFRSQVIGAPDWASSERYDINAKVNRALFDSTAGDPLRTPKLVQWLLEDRFKVRAHREMRKMSVYALVRAGQKADGQRLRAVHVDCDHNRDRCAIKFVPGHLTAGAITMDALASMLSPPDSTVTDKPSIFTALQEQLGLNLESTHEPVDVVVIDHVERPMED
jgi:uncharacterized protein (TIGR03435 family)